MNNYEDYQLEEMENEAVNKSNNFKKAAVVGAAVLGVGGTAAYGASKLADGMNSDDQLTSDDMMSVAEAGEVTNDVVEAAPEAPAAEPVQNVTNVYIMPEPEPEISVDETGYVYDENLNRVATFDSGTYDGKAFMVVDNDGNGRADVLVYDENGNGHIESNEIYEMDNQSYHMGQGSEHHAYIRDSNTGELYQIDGGVRYADNANHDNDLDGIHNDFSDEKEGEGYDDLAHNNPDYNNHAEGNDYNAGMNGIDANEKYDGLAEDSYDGYEEPSYENNYGMESYDDIQNDNLADNTDMGGFDEGSEYTA